MTIRVLLFAVAALLSSQNGFWLTASSSPAHGFYLKAGFERVSRPEDGFIYNVVAVPSFEDALIGILFNHNILNFFFIN